MASMIGHSSEILLSLPLAGAVLGLLWWSRPMALKIWALLIAASVLGVVIGSAGAGARYLLPLAALAAILAESSDKEARTVLLGILLFLQLGLAILSDSGGESDLGMIFLAGLLGLLTTLLYIRSHKLNGAPIGWGSGTYGVGFVCLLISMPASPPVRDGLLFVVYAMLLPLFPFHGGYLAALAELPGPLSAFLAVLIPTIGLHGLLILLPTLPAETLQAVAFLALAGALYGSLKALLEPRTARLAAYAGLAFFSILWWSLATTLSDAPYVPFYASAVALVTEGLLLAGHGVQIRYGDLESGRIGGLAGPMPRLGILLSLLAMAAMGLPPFGLFTAYMQMLMNPSTGASWGLAIALLTWLVASWYFLDLMQRILFGPLRPNITYQDLRHSEVASLLIVLFILIVLGVTPHR